MVPAPATMRVRLGNVPICRQSGIAHTKLRNFSVEVRTVALACSNIRSTTCHAYLMAGGMGRRAGSGIPLRDRSAQPASPPECPLRHVWVAASVDGAGVKRPGLLVEWRRNPTTGSWEGLVHYGAEFRPGHWGVVEEWVPHDLLTPA